MPALGLRQYCLKITSTQADLTTITVDEWDIPAASYPHRRAQVRLVGVAFPAHSDALDALRTALDVLEKGP